MQELKIALGTVNDVNPAPGYGGSYSSNSLQVSGHGTTSDDDGKGTSSLAKKTHGEIIYRDSSTFLKVSFHRLCSIIFYHISTTGALFVCKGYTII